MKVYIVSDGEYSDWDICCICSTMESAEHAKKWYCAKNDIKEYELDALPSHPTGTFRYVVDMDRDGNTSRVEMIEPDGVDDSSYEWEPNGSGQHDVAFIMWAEDKKHAVKIASQLLLGLKPRSLQHHRHAAIGRLTAACP